MSGRKITDFGGLPHTSDMAMKSKNYLKEYSSAEGSGHLGSKYPDTTEDIKRDQLKGDGKIKGHAIKEGYRY
jgi:hypothetical protein